MSWLVPFFGRRCVAGFEGQCVDGDQADHFSGLIAFLRDDGHPLHPCGRIALRLGEVQHGFGVGRRTGQLVGLQREERGLGLKVS